MVFWWAEAENISRMTAERENGETLNKNIHVLLKEALKLLCFCVLPLITFGMVVLESV